MAGQDPVFLTSPAGRLIWGSATEKQTTGYQNKPIEPDKQQFQFGLALRKDNPGTMPLLQALYAQAFGGYPTNAFIQNRINEEWSSGFMAGKFAFKVRDGDKPNPTTGTINSNAAGCYVLSFGTTLPFKGAYGGAKKADGSPHGDAYGRPYNINSEIPLSLIKIGHWVDIHFSCRVNGNTDDTAGIYLNQSVVRWLAEDAEITGGPSTEQAFGNVPIPQLPQGVGVPSNPTPQGGGLPGAPGLPPAIAPNAGQPPGVAQGYAPPVNPGQPPVNPTPAGAPGLPPGPGAGGMPGLPTASPSNPPAYPAFGQPPGLPG